MWSLSFQVVKTDSLKMHQIPANDLVKGIVFDYVVYSPLILTNNRSLNRIPMLVDDHDPYLVEIKTKGITFDYVVYSALILT